MVVVVETIKTNAMTFQSSVKPRKTASYLLKRWPRPKAAKIKKCKHEHYALA